MIRIYSLHESVEFGCCLYPTQSITWDPCSRKFNYHWQEMGDLQGGGAMSNVEEPLWAIRPLGYLNLPLIGS